MNHPFNKQIFQQYNIIKTSPCIIASLLLLFTTACGSGIESKEQAFETIHKLVEKEIKPSYNENRVRANIQLTKTNLLSMLPDLAEYPLTLQTRDSETTEVVEIFTSSEKAGKGRDGFYIEMANQFNQLSKKTSTGKLAVINIRKIASGLGAQFMLAHQYIPDAYSPSNFLWADMLNANGIKTATIAEKTAPNTAGIVVKKSKLDQITENGKLNIGKLLTNVSAGSFAMGYTNPYQSSTGLNFLLTILNSFAQGDESQMLSPDVASAFEAFQTGVPFVAQNTLQMRDATLGSGVLDAFVMEYQSWINVSGMNDYQFIPFGIRHDSPLYATPEADKSEREVLKMFNTFLQSQKKKMKDYGFNQNPNYKNAFQLKDNSIIGQAQKLWKQKKSGGRPIAAFFVADTSGSMEGSRIKNLKKALIESSDLISTNNAIGLITYNDRVNVDLFIKQAIVEQATDIHISPDEQVIRVSYRVDGIMRVESIMPKKLYSGIITRVKVLSGLNIAEQRLPQGGAINYEYAGRYIDIRTSVMPTANGENIVLRLLDKANIVVGLDKLGLEKDDNETIINLSNKPHGIVLSAGPTG